MLMNKISKSWLKRCVHVCLYLGTGIFLVNVIFLKKKSHICFCMDVCICRWLKRPEAVRCPGVEVISCHDPPDTGAGNQTKLRSSPRAVTAEPSLQSFTYLLPNKYSQGNRRFTASQFLCYNNTEFPWKSAQSRRRWQNSNSPPTSPWSRFCHLKGQGPEPGSAICWGFQGFN